VTTRTAQQQSRKSTTQTPDTDLRTYVLDTSVLLSDPQAFFRFAEHSIVLPVVVITELEGKRHDPEIGYFATWMSSGSNTAGSTSRCRSAKAERSAWS